MKEENAHKFFERILDNNLENLYSFLIEKNNEFIDKAYLKMDTETDKLSMISSKPELFDNLSTKNNEEYNLWEFNNPEIKNLKRVVADMTREACEYYGHNDNSVKFITHAWFNVEKKVINKESSVDPREKSSHFHDHLDGSGFPQLHGFYCVKAEPSVTYYKINNKDIFENVNKNNRAILAQTGSPHGRGDWHEEEERITIAYDVIAVPVGPVDSGSIFVDLFE
jgi:hypothetical protein